MATVLDMSISLDGFIARPDEDPGPLHDWVFSDPSMTHADLVAGSPGGVNGQVFGELLATGAVVAGRKTFEPAGGWNGDHHHGVPIFIYARGEHGPMADRWPLVTYLDDVGEAMRRAREAAGDKDVLVHGAGTGAAALTAGVLDELELHVVPVLLGRGRPLFDGLAEEIGLERVRVLEGEHGVTHHRYRVRR